MSKKGHCARHGNCTFWLACEHIRLKNPNRITLAKQEIAMCLHCAMEIDKLNEDNFAPVCDECLRDFVRLLLMDVEKEEDIKKTVLGLEYLGGIDDRKGS